MSKLWLLLLLPVAMGAFIGGAYGFYYRGEYTPPPTPALGLEDITIAAPLVRGFAEAPSLQEGVFVVDRAHRNQFNEAELASLLSRGSATGYTIDTLEPEFGAFARLAGLESKLREADVLAVVAPAESFTEQEVDLVRQFVDKGRQAAAGERAQPPP